MSLENKIKDAFKNTKVLGEDLQLKADEHPNTYELDNYLKKAGYKLLELIEHEGSKVPEVLLEPKNPGYLFPQISHIVKEDKFYVDVVKYGMLEASDLEKVMQGYENALSVVTYLENLDLSKLEIVRKG